MTQNNLTILFWINKSKINSTGEVPIYCRITINGRRVELATHRFIKPNSWNTTKWMTKGASEEKKTFNNFLELFAQKVKSCEVQLIKLDQEVTALSR